MAQAKAAGSLAKEAATKKPRAKGRGTGMSPEEEAVEATMTAAEKAGQENGEVFDLLQSMEATNPDEFVHYILEFQKERLVSK